MLHQFGLDGGVNRFGYVGGNPFNNLDYYGLCFLGKNLAKKYIDKYGNNAWEKIRADRDSKKPVVPGTLSEEIRNAEHYLYSRKEVIRNSYNWGVMLVASVGYNTTKFWVNVGEYYGLNKSPWTYSVNTTDELKAGIEGANDGLYGDDGKCECNE